MLTGRVLVVTKLPQILLWMQDQAATDQQSHSSIFAACNTGPSMTAVVPTILAGNLHVRQDQSKHVSVVDCCSSLRSSITALTILLPTTISTMATVKDMNNNEHQYHCLDQW